MQSPSSLLWAENAVVNEGPRSARRDTSPVLPDGSAFDTGDTVRGPDRFGFGRSPLPQIDGQHHHAADGEEFRLPILQGAIPEVRGEHVGDVGVWVLKLIQLLFVVRGVARDGLGEPTGHEDQPHDQAE